MGFEHQQPSINLGFCRAAPQQQQIGVRLKPDEKKGDAPRPQRPPERRAV
jgi:hypothetical protein